jgi:hypothetical protein
LREEGFNPGLVDEVQRRTEEASKEEVKEDTEKGLA